MKKKLTSVLLAIALLLTCIPLGAVSVSAETSDGYTYTVSNGEATITGHSTGSYYGGAITIPSTLGRYPVTSIGNSAFYSCDSLTSVTIPDSVTSIGDSAFYNCTSLTSVTIPDSVTSIGWYAFNSCDSLTSVTIPDSVTSIGGYTFYNCTSLTSVTIPDSVTSIGNAAFDSCDSLTSINVDQNSTKYCSVDGVLFNKDKTTLIQYPAGKTFTAYSIPDSVTSIGDYAFDSCDSLTSVTIPDSVTSIGESAFRYCSSLTSVIIPDSVTSIGESAFRGCSSLTSVTIPDSVTSIGYHAFNNCNSLTSVTIPDSVTSIGSYAFRGCSSLTSIALPFVGANADGSGTTYLGYIFGASSYTGNANYVPASLKEVSITGGAAIDENAFYNCDSLTSVTIGDSVTSIGDGAFYHCNSLTSVTIPSSVTSIGDDAFYKCNQLTDVWYTGSETDRNAITIGSENSCLKTAIWHYNTCADEHNFTASCDTDCDTCEWVRTVESHPFADATCTAPKTCTVCGATDGAALGHDYDHACDTTCNRCYETRTITHDYADATCTEPKTCSVCGATDGAALGHDYDHACDTACNRCYETRTITHDYTDATCTAPKTCKVCGATSGSALGHTYTNDCDGTCNRCDHKRTPSPHVYTHELCDVDCDECGAVRTAPHLYTDNCDIDCNLCKALRKVTHTFDNDCDEYCNVCGDWREVPDHEYSHRCDRDCNVCYAIRTVTHKYTNKCDNTCNYCGAKRKVAAHNYKLTVAKKATATKNGYSIKTCTECGKTEGDKVTIYKIGHVKLSTTTYTYTGSTKKPAVTVKNSMGKTISSKYYTVTYASGRKNVGTYKVTVKFKGNYSGTKTLTFKINPAKTTVKSLTAGKKSLKVAITKKSTQVTGYQIQYSTGKSFKSYKTKWLTSYKKTSTTLTGLSAKKTYYVRVRTYKKVGGVTYYSGWSTIKYKKTK